jgi:hypothetical protein
MTDTPDDFKSKQRWRDKLNPYHHEVTNLITFCRRLPVTVGLQSDAFGEWNNVARGAARICGFDLNDISSLQ